MRVYCEIPHHATFTIDFDLDSVEPYDFRRSAEGNTGFYFARSNNRTVKLWADAVKAAQRYSFYYAVMIMLNVWLDISTVAASLNCFCHHIVYVRSSNCVIVFIATVYRFPGLDDQAVFWIVIRQSLDPSVMHIGS